MNRNEFLEKIATAVDEKEGNLDRMSRWYELTMAVLKAYGEQKEGVDHPSYRGISREKPLKQLLSEILPATMLVHTGFALNCNMAASREQDILVIDGNNSIKVLPEDNYFPIESCLASIQVKSKLTANTIRDATINCASIKRVFSEDAEDQENDDSLGDELCYGVFAYGSDLSLDKLGELMNKEMLEVKRCFWPNVIYVLGKGMLIPGDEHGVTVDTETMFRGDIYHGIAHAGAPNSDTAESESQPFLWFLSNIIDHCFEQREARKAVRYGAYWFTPIQRQL